MIGRDRPQKNTEDVSKKRPLRPAPLMGKKVARDRGNAATLRRWWIPCVIAAATLAAFLPALQNGFVDWDDDANFLNNPNYRGLGWRQLSWMFTTFHKGHYQPLSWMSWGLDYLLWGMNPFGYHLTNLLLHSANAVLFYFIARRLLELASPGSDQRRDLHVSIAAAWAALFFALHPLRVESVAWITERRDVLSAHFLFWTLWCYLRAAAGQETASDRRRWLTITWVFFLLSLLSKAWGMTLPVLLAILDVYPLKRLSWNPAKWLTGESRRVLLEKVLFVIPAVIFALVAFIAQQSTGAIENLEAHPLSRRIAQAFYGLAFYLWRTLWPTSLSPLYPIDYGFDPFSLSYLLSALTVLAITAILFIMRKRWPAGLAAWLCYIVLLSPVLGLVQSGPQLVADRYSYLSCLGWALLAGWGIEYFRAYLQTSGRFLAGGLSAAMILVLMGLSVLTWKQTEVWHDSERLWRHTVSLNPESIVARNLLGHALADRGALDDAIEQYRQALRIRPTHAGTHNNLAIALADRGDLDGAIQHYEAVVRLKPTNAHAYNSLADAIFAQGKFEEAIEYWRLALRYKPEAADIHFNLATALAKLGRLDEAIAQFREALAIDPHVANAHYNLAQILDRRGESDAAMTHYLEAVQGDPANADAYYNLGVILANRGQLNPAIEYFREAIRARPDFPQARKSLDLALSLQARNR